MTPLSAIVLAAGEGTRMRSTRPKPLHVLCGKAMVLYVLDSLGDLTLERAVVVVGHDQAPCAEPTGVSDLPVPVSAAARIARTMPA